MEQLTLWSGRSEAASRVVDFILKAEFPEQTRFVWGMAKDMPLSLLGLLQGAAWELIIRGHEVVMVGTDPSPNFRADAWERHDTVAQLYTKLWGCTRRSLVFTLEDDNIPLDLAIVPWLWNSIAPGVAAVAGVYRIRGIESCLNCHVGPPFAELWEPQRADLCPQEVFESPFVGAGATLWRGDAVRRCLPLVATRKSPTWIDGWDGCLGRRLYAAGMTVWSDGRLWVEHDNAQVRKFLSDNKLSR